MKNKVIFVVGPTAVGKTDTAIHLAKTLKGEIISADSMQIYRYMDIGTAKPTLEEREGIPHYLMDCVDPDTPFTVADFQREAMELIRAITARGNVPIVAGGTGLYVHSLLYEMDFTSSSANQSLRLELEEEARTKGPLSLHERLQALDPEAAKRIHPNNVKRVIRALEVNLEGGETMGDFRQNLTPNPEISPYLIGLTRDRESLYERINQRVEIMLNQGLVAEVQRLLDMGYPENLVAFQGLGYKEIIHYLKGRMTYEDAIDKLKQGTRRYAKRQLTWFRRYPMMNWYNLSDYDDKEKLFAEILQGIEGHFNSISNM